MTDPQAAPVMIMVAPTGARALKADNAAIPITPKEIADEVVRCARAGASIAHIHARRPDGQPTQSIEVFREIVSRIRDKSDIVIQISLGTRGFTVEQAIEPVVLRPEMVSLPLDSFQRDDPEAHEGVRLMALHVRSHGVRPELSVYDAQMMEGALGLVASGAIDMPAFFGLVVRDPQSMREGVARLTDLLDRLPQGANWWMLSGGRYVLEMRALAISLGGHVRIGFEDTLKDFDGERPAPSNAYLVERIAGLCAALGRPVATPKDVRAVLEQRASQPPTPTQVS